MRPLNRRRFERLDDEALLAHARRGDGDAFAVFYRRHLALVLGYLRHRTPTPETAADLTAETFAAALAALHEPHNEAVERPVAWLMSIAHNNLVDSLRRGQVENRARRKLGHARLELDDRDLERVEELASQTDIAQQLAKSLPGDQLTVLQARVLDERSYPEIAEQLECSQSVVRQRLSRALSRLRGQIEQR